LERAVTPVAVRFLERRDIPAILRIQADSLEAAQWSQFAYERLGRAGEEAWVAGGEEHLIGFLVVRAVASEMEILNLAVLPTARRRGIGRALLQHALSWASSHGTARVFLEVRHSNAVARQFYEAHGFVGTGTRRNYYQDPVEDALLLMRNVDPC
jgi:[ribosomal protein S18]-alanine N-acetyltransferase